MLTRLAAFAVHRRRTVLLAWLVLFVLGIVVGSKVFSHLKDSPGNSSAESVRGFRLIDDATTHGMGLVVLVDGARVSEPATRDAVTNLTGRLSRIRGVQSVTSTYTSADPMLRAQAGDASLILVGTEKSDDVAFLRRLLDDVRDAAKGAVPGAHVKVGGELAVMGDEIATSQTDLVRGEMIALPLLLLALLLVFRGWRPALLPLAGALVTVAGALLLLLGATGVVDVAGYAVDVVALFGLALAVDYNLLMVSRFREERLTSGDCTEAVLRATRSAGRTVIYSALTVTASLAGLLVFDDPTFTSLALGGIATTLVALLAAVTLTPALLSTWGQRITGQAPGHAEDGGFARLARRIQRRPLLVALGTVSVLLAAGIPFLGVRYGSGDPRLLPRTFESRQVADVLLARFPGMQADPLRIVGRLPANDPRVAPYADSLRTLPGVAAVSVSSSVPGLAVVEVVPTGTSQGPAAERLVSTLRAQRPPYPSWVTGTAAFLVDTKSHLAARLPWGAALIALATFALLFLMTGSVLVPLKALVMNALSLTASFGALVWIFQHGHLSGLLKFEAFGAIEVWVPIVVFVFAFGLSMDYEVFMLSRIKERYDATGDNDAAVAAGLQRSGRIITSAAGLVVIVFAGFAAGQNLGIKQMGTALAIAVVVDATLVRSLLVPATMTLLGAANWWAPEALKRMYARMGLREQVDAPLQLRLPSPRSGRELPAREEAARGGR